ncbi:MAG: O-antigen ligase family protein [Armatimonadota bacterium]
MKKTLRKTKAVPHSPPTREVPLATWLLGAVLVLAPLTTGRLEVGSEPVEPSLGGIVVALFSTSTMLSVAVWMVALLVLTALVWEWVRQPVKGDAVPRAARVLAMLLLVWFLTSVFGSVYRWGTLVAWGYWVIAIVAAWLFSQRRGEDIVIAIHALAIAGTLAALFAIREYAQNVRDVANWRVFGTFFNPDFLAGYLCLTLPVTLAVALATPASRPNNQSVRWLAGFGAWLQVGALLLTGSRFGAICAVLSLMTMAVWMALNRSWNRRHVRDFVLFCLVALLTAGLAARPLTQRVAAQAVQAESHSGGFRIWTWKGTLAMAKAKPLFGTGLGTYEIAYPRFAVVGFTRLAHNSYLQIAAEAGIPSLLLLVSTLATMAWVTVRREETAMHEVHGWDARVLRAGMAGAITAGLARNLVDSDWSIFACLLTFWAVVGLMLALSLPSSQEGQTKAGRLYFAHALLLLLALPILTLRMAGALSANGANWSLMQGVPDEEGFQRALRWEPYNGDHLLSLGMLYYGMARAGDTSRTRDAVQYLRRSARMMPLSKTWYHLGNLYRDVLGEDAKAIEAYRHALEVDPHALRVMVELGKTLERAGNLRGAEQVYRRMLDIEASVYNRVRAIPELPEVDYAFAYAGLARLARAQGRLEEARNLYTRALQILEADRSARANNPMAQALSRPPEREHALEELRVECERALKVQR